MNNVRNIFLSITCLIVAASSMLNCREDGLNPTSSTPIVDDNTFIFKLDKNEIVVTTASEYETTLTITSYNVKWEFISTPDWVTVSPQKGFTGQTPVRILLNDNTNEGIRTGKLVCRENGVNDTTIIVSQYGTNTH